MPRSTVIIPAYNQARVTAQCLKALVGRTSAEILVVDDGSTDVTRAAVERWGKRVGLIQHPMNQGFAAACNDGAAAASSREFLVFLNNDTIPRPGWLEALEAYADRHAQAAAVGAKLLYPDHTIQHAGVVICQDRYPRHIYTGFPADHPAVNTSRRFPIVTAACLLVRRTVFERAKGFDTAFRNGFEDVDLCLRLGEQGGEIHYCAESVLTHLESVAPGRFKESGRNVALYRERWLERVEPDDLEYYVQDGLLEVDYEGRYPVGLKVSPLLATIDEGVRDAGRELVLRQRSREVMELERENVRLRVARGASASDSDYLRYQRLIEEIREAVRHCVPAGSTVLVISRGDSRLLDLPGCTGWHFPRNERGAYAGHHPASSDAAVAHLRALQAKGADYLLIPATAIWWLEHYAGLLRHLNTGGERMEVRGDPCLIYRLDKAKKPEAIMRASKPSSDPGIEPAQSGPRSRKCPARLSMASNPGSTPLQVRLDQVEAALQTSRCRQQWLEEELNVERHARQVLEAAVSATYSEAVAHIREVVCGAVPQHATVLVVSRGDPELVQLHGRRAWHFPQDDGGGYAGHYPTDSAEAIAHLQALLAKGADYLLFPCTAFWWLTHYRDFERHLERAHLRIWRDDRCALFKLRPETKDPPKSAEETPVLQHRLTDVPLVKPQHDGCYDIVCFPVIDWDSRFQRPQQLMTRLGAAGHRVFYLSHTFAQTGPAYNLRQVAENVHEVTLRGAGLKVRAGVLDEVSLRALLDALTQLRALVPTEPMAAIVESPFWWPLAREATAAFGWPVVYDCLDLQSGFVNTHPRGVEQEEEMLTRADLVVAASAPLEARARQFNPRVILVRNGCDYEHFAQVPPKVRGPRPVIGYYGAIAEWFDTDLVADLAERRPDWDFLLVGATAGADLRRLSRLANASLPGEQPYAALPQWLARFDVAILPFKCTPLTEAANPVKLYEILAAGRPLVSVPLPETRLLASLVCLATGVDQFARQIEELLGSSGELLPSRRRAFARRNTWQSRAEAMALALRDRFTAQQADPRAGRKMHAHVSSFLTP